ncbi:Hypothetical protein R9X50_00175400 [Acrodontium crateriforme]|uniref:Uncharacterized protein n=1 Tax=Acrodontium crateriforme TaxID=150365 RepID=A0AAQ3M097_9PEZI|nr:Hypothetical protein R9X50_00175400 [Acrodontium crateriforme]
MYIVIFRAESQLECVQGCDVAATQSSLPSFFLSSFLNTHTRLEHTTSFLCFLFFFELHPRSFQKKKTINMPSSKRARSVASGSDRRGVRRAPLFTPSPLSSASASPVRSPSSSPPPPPRRLVTPPRIRELAAAAAQKADRAAAAAKKKAEEDAVALAAARKVIAEKQAAKEKAAKRAAEKEKERRERDLVPQQRRRRELGPVPINPACLRYWYGRI